MLAHKPVALRQVGPKCAFFTNRAIEAFDKTRRSLKRKAPSPVKEVPPPTSPTPDTSAAPTYRSLSSCGDGPEPPLRATASSSPLLGR